MESAKPQCGSEGGVEEYNLGLHVGGLCKFANYPGFLS
jgi:hypothetical protein